MKAIAQFFRRGDYLALGFGTTIAMWAVGYVGRHPAVLLPSPLLLVLMVLCILLGGIATGYYTWLGWKGGMYVGVFVAVLNLLIFGSLIVDHESNQARASAVIWLPGSILLSALIAGLGASFGQNAFYRKRDEIHWTGVFTKSACAATFFLLIAGGLVTSKQAGLAVVDWPNSFGYNMFLLPLSRMSGGVYYEHAHRLFGSLVGLTTIAVAVHLWLTDSRSWLKKLALAAVVLVIVQGILGGLRVTGHFTLSTSEEVVKPNIYLAITHGVMGQVFFGVMVAIAVFSTKTWMKDLRRTVRNNAPTDYFLNEMLLVLLVIQLVYGALVRHISGGLLFHISLATIVLLNVIGSGIRAWGMNAGQPILEKLGLWLISLTVLQIALGLGALVAISYTTSPDNVALADMALTTMHQANGAVLLAVAVMLTLWTRRLVVKEEAV